MNDTGYRLIFSSHQGAPIRHKMKILIGLLRKSLTVICISPRISCKCSPSSPSSSSPLISPISSSSHLLSVFSTFALLPHFSFSATYFMSLLQLNKIPHPHISIHYPYPLSNTLSHGHPPSPHLTISLSLHPHLSPPALDFTCNELPMSGYVPPMPGIGFISFHLRR